MKWLSRFACTQSMAQSVNDLRAILDSYRGRIWRNIPNMSKNLPQLAEPAYTKD